MNLLADFQTRIGVEFKDVSLLERAFIHRSYLNEHPKLGLEHNERIEFLGDAVLELVVTDFLYRNYPNPEGDLTYGSLFEAHTGEFSVSAQTGAASFLPRRSRFRSST